MAYELNANGAAPSSHLMRDALEEMLELGLNPTKAQPISDRIDFFDENGNHIGSITNLAVPVVN